MLWIRDQASEWMHRCRYLTHRRPLSVQRLFHRGRTHCAAVAGRVAFHTSPAALCATGRAPMAGCACVGRVSSVPDLDDSPTVLRAKRSQVVTPTKNAWSATHSDSGLEHQAAGTASIVTRLVGMPDAHQDQPESRSGSGPCLVDSHLNESRAIWYWARIPARSTNRADSELR
jgi:hypothetical protein